MSLNDHLRTIFGDRQAPDGSLVWENFAAWFGLSAIVGPDGRPLVVYHGTDNDFSAFNMEKIGSATDAGDLGRGFYFSTDPRVIGQRKVGMPAYLRAENPLRVEMPNFRTDKRSLVPRDLADYDAVILDYTPTGYLHKEILVRTPGQIKSAIGNSGLFRLNDHDITDGSALELGKALQAKTFIDVMNGLAITKRNGVATPHA